MEYSTGGLNLGITTNATFENDDIKETILKYGDNFLEIERYLRESSNTPEGLADGSYIEKGKIIWNENPITGGYVGWVNTRQGKHTRFWQPSTHYSIGEEVKAYPDNGNIYRCVTGGKSSVESPVWNIGINTEFYDANGMGWQPNYNYEVNDVIFSRNGSKLFYYICETSGFTGVNEPIWTNLSAGGTLIDGSVVWRKEATIKWKQVGTSSNFRPFGKIE